MTSTEMAKPERIIKAEEDLVNFITSDKAIRVWQSYYGGLIQYGDIPRELGGQAILQFGYPIPKTVWYYLVEALPALLELHAGYKGYPADHFNSPCYKAFHSTHIVEAFGIMEWRQLLQVAHKEITEIHKQQR
jgi:hypothetical protein